MTMLEPKLELFCDLRLSLISDLYDSSLLCGPPAEHICLGSSHVPSPRPRSSGFSSLELSGAMKQRLSNLTKASFLPDERVS